jgi:hypothetical protein
MRGAPAPPRSIIRAQIRAIKVSRVLSPPRSSRKNTNENKHIVPMLGLDASGMTALDLWGGYLA